MRLRRWNRTTWAAPVLAALALCGYLQPPCRGQQASAGWTPLVQALQATAGQGVPTVVVVTSQSTPASQALRDALGRAAVAQVPAGSVLFAEMPVEAYASQVKTLNISKFPCLMVYRRGKAGVEAAGLRDDLTDAQQVFAWLATLSLRAAPAAITAATAPADSSVARSNFPQSPTEQNPQPPPLPKQPPCAAPPAYAPPPPQYAPPPQQYAPPPQQYVPAPAPSPYYVQTQAPAMIVQQAPQQIILAPPSAPQVTVAMPPPVAYAAAPAPNLFTQPVQVAQPQPVMLAPQPQPVMLAPQPQPVMLAPQPQPVQMVQAPQPVSQAPVTALLIQPPSLLNNLIGTIGEHLAQLRNPRIRLSSMATLAPASMALAPAAAYAPAAQPVAQVTPESTSFAPCNTYHAPCKYHGGPCPGPGGGYVPPPPPYPSPTPQSGTAPGAGSGCGWFNWIHRN